MDTVLIKTFLEVVACDSFAAAADRLYVSQSAVSLRIKSLEQQLGRPVFRRSKAGISLTPAGSQFVRYANSFLQIWEDAKQQVAIPAHYEDLLVVAGEDGLWSGYLSRCLPKIAEALPQLAFRADVGRSEQITQSMLEGVIDLAILYRPYSRPGISTSELFADELTLVSTEQQTSDIDDSYIYIDWGEGFNAFHAQLFPQYEHARMSFRQGQESLNYVLENGGSAFLPIRLAQPMIASGQLFPVPAKPSFTYPVHAVWRSELDLQLLQTALNILRKEAGVAPQARYKP